MTPPGTDIQRVMLNTHAQHNAGYYICEQPLLHQGGLGGRNEATSDFKVTDR
jgi:hypothetical protein